MVFNGKVEYIFTCTERFSESGMKVTFFNRDWNRLPFERTYCSREISRPGSFEEMLILAEELARGIPFVRVDFYEICHRPLFGEMTFYPGTGLEKFSLLAYDRMMGKLIQI